MKLEEVSINHAYYFASFWRRIKMSSYIILRVSPTEIKRLSDILHIHIERK